MQLQQGTRLQGGKYTIEGTLGQGGFGITYLAVQSVLNRKVAIKEFFIKSLCERDADTSHVAVPTQSNREMVARFREKFINEAQTIAALNNPHIVRIHDIFEENGTAYYVMEYHDGGSLADVVAQRGSLSETEAVRYTREIADALDYLHKNHRNHLDVKPANILLANDGSCVLIDFGISKHYDENGDETASGIVGISQGYAPLEQYEEKGVSIFSPATDIYSLGATFYKLLTGITPPKAGEVLNHGLPKLPAGISPLVRNAVKQAMQPRQCDRPQSISAFLALIDEPQSIAVIDDSPTLLDDDVQVEVIGHGNEPAKATPIKTGEPAAKEEKRRYTPAVKEEKEKSSGCLWMVLLSLIVVAIAALFYSQSQEQYGTREDETINPQSQEQDGTRADETINLSVSSSIDNHDYVDLGLPSGLKWATCNVGATYPEDYGDYFAWGETTPKSSYTDDNCKTDKKNISDISGKPQYDAARSNWGGSWRLPTKEEMQELIDNCTWEWTTYNGKKGCLVTSKKNNNSIFLPAAGYRGGTSLYSAGDGGYYWTSTPYEGSTQGAYGLLLNSDRHGVDWYYRYDGQSVRPVSK